MFAGAIHGVVSPAHFDEWWGYGLFFMMAAAAQVLFGLALVTRAIGPHSGPGWRLGERRLWTAGIAGNTAIILLYVVTRTLGVPYGPDLGQAEAIGVLDVASTVAEVLVVAGLGWLLVAGRAKDA